MRILSVDLHRTEGRGGMMVPGNGARIAAGFEALGHTVERVNVQASEEPTVAQVRRADLCWMTCQILRWWEPGARWCAAIRAAGVPFVANYDDARLAPEPWMSALVHADLVTYAVGGWRLQWLARAVGLSRIAFLPGALAPTQEPDWDVDRQVQWVFGGQWPNDLGDGARQQDLWIARELLGDALEHPGVWGQTRLGASDYDALLDRARRGIASSHFHAGWPKYASHRGMHYAAHGVDVLHRWYEGCEEMLPPSAQVYRDESEFRAALSAPRDTERAREGRAWAVEQFDASVVAAAVLDYLDAGSAEPTWSETWESTRPEAVAVRDFESRR